MKRLGAAARALQVVGVGAAVTILAWSAVAGASPPREAGSGHAVVAKPAVSTSPTIPVRPAFSGAVIASLVRATPYSNAPGGPTAGTLEALNPYGQQQALAVIGRPASEWVQVELPQRPNGSTGWIRTAGVSLTETNYRVVVSTERYTISIFNGPRLVLTAPAAVGKPGTPTPTGRTYLWELIRPDNPSGAYGPYIFGLALFSTAYSVFNGGDAEIGIHGQDEPWSIGHAASHGCVRLANDLITQLAGMLPLGTPVTIT